MDAGTVIFGLVLGYVGAPLLLFGFAWVGSLFRKPELRVALNIPERPVSRDSFSAREEAALRKAADELAASL